MNKSELIANMAEDSGLSKTEASKALDAITESIKDALGKSEKIALVGFGTFSVAERSARKGRNPQTGAEIDIPATKIPKFKAGIELKTVVKQRQTGASA